MRIPFFILEVGENFLLLTSAMSADVCARKGERRIRACNFGANNGESAACFACAASTRGVYPRSVF